MISINISELLKIATTFKKENKIDEAINTLRKVYELIPNSHIDFGIEPYLRLPMYLQESGRTDEAWFEFNQLLSGNYYKENDFGYYSDLAKIHDKCRIFLERDSRYKLALEHKILWYIYDSKHFYTIKTNPNSRKIIKTNGTNTFNNRLNGKIFFMAMH